LTVSDSSRHLLRPGPPHPRGLARGSIRGRRARGAGPRVPLDAKPRPVIELGAGRRAAPSAEAKELPGSRPRRRHCGRRRCGRQHCAVAVEFRAPGVGKRSAAVGGRVPAARRRARGHSAFRSFRGPGRSRRSRREFFSRASSSRKLALRTRPAAGRFAQRVRVVHCRHDHVRAHRVGQQPQCPLVEDHRVDVERGCTGRRVLGSADHVVPLMPGVLHPAQPERERPPRARSRSSGRRHSVEDARHRSCSSDSVRLSGHSDEPRAIQRSSRGEPGMSHGCTKTGALRAARAGGTSPHQRRSRSYRPRGYDLHAHVARAGSGRVPRTPRPRPATAPGTSAPAARAAGAQISRPGVMILAMRTACVTSPE